MTCLSSPTPGGKGISSSNAARYFTTFGGQRFSRICDLPGHYDVLVDVFLGGGGVAFGHPYGCKHVITSDVDPGVLALAQCWGDAGLRRQVEQEIEGWKSKIIRSPSGAFAGLKNIHDNARSISVSERAAVFLTIKRLTFGGVLRCNRQGKLNVALSQDKLDKYLRGWNYEWPNNGVKTLDVHHGWQGAVQALADSNYENALVVIDAPYWTPGHKMTEAYTHHGDPGSDEVMALTTDCLDAVLATGKAGRIVVFNYYSDALQEEIWRLYSKHFYQAKDVPDIWSSDLGPLSTMNNGQGTAYHEYYSEAVWEIGGRRMFQDYDAVEQGSLLEVAL